MAEITQTISTMTSAPLSTDGETVFTGKADPFLSGIEAMPAQYNAFGSQVNSLRTDVLAAQTAAETAETNAETAVTNAGTARDNSSKWASQEATTGKINDGVNTQDYSSKAYAVDDLTGSDGGSSKDWAITAENSVVSDGKYSAYHWAMQAAQGERLTATSTTSIAIGTGSKTLTLSEEYRAFISGTLVRVCETSDPSSNYMEGVVTNYDSSTDILTVLVSNAHGSGTISAWSIAMNHGGDADTVDGYHALDLVPSQTSNTGKFLTTDGTNTSWENISPEPLFLTGAI